MYTCIYVCMHIYIHIHINTYLHICTYVYINIITYIHTYIDCTYPPLPRDVHIIMNICKCVRACVLIVHTCRCARTCACINVSVCAHLKMYPYVAHIHVRM